MVRNVHAGIIPACAGSTVALVVPRSGLAGSSPHARGALTSTRQREPTSRDHPRMRGEHSVDPLPTEVERGIIPACAGSTPSVLEIKTASAGSSPHARGALRSSRRRSPCGGDHPRMRGEHTSSSATPVSSPRIIPACAGSTRARALLVMSDRGSSPHARGAPACSSRSPSASRDHPRMRGEHPRRLSSMTGVAGIIPACAGSTINSLRNLLVCVGSSPHARGAPNRDS